MKKEKTMYDLECELTQVLADLPDVDVIPLHNELCSENDYYSDYIEYMDCFSDLFYGMKIEDFLMKYDVKNLSFNNTYFQISDSGDIESFDYASDYILYDLVARMILEDYKYYLNQKIPQKIKDVILENIEMIEE